VRSGKITSKKTRAGKWIPVYSTSDSATGYESSSRTINPRAFRRIPSAKPVKWLPNLKVYKYTGELHEYPYCPECFSLVRAGHKRRAGIVILYWACLDQCGWWLVVEPGTAEAFRHAAVKRRTYKIVSRAIRRASRTTFEKNLKILVEEHKAEKARAATRDHRRGPRHRAGTISASTPPIEELDRDQSDRSGDEGPAKPDGGVEPAHD
jgi:hypothetical protein